MDPIITALASAAYVLIAVRVYVVIKRKGCPTSGAFFLGAMWPFTMLIIGVVVPLSGDAGIYGESH